MLILVQSSFEAVRSLHNPQSEVQIPRVNEADFELQAGKESKKCLQVIQPPQTS